MMLQKGRRFVFFEVDQVDYGETNQVADSLVQLNLSLFEPLT
jgi:hypothetical protein